MRNKGRHGDALVTNNAICMCNSGKLSCEKGVLKAVARWKHSDEMVGINHLLPSFPQSSPSSHYYLCVCLIERQRDKEKERQQDQELEGLAF